MLLLLIFAASRLSAQTPVEKVIIKYGDTQGARNFMAQGLKMTLARKLLNSTPVAPISADVDKLAVLKMEGTSQNVRLHFVSDLNDAFKSYQYYGKFPSKNGDVDVYVHHNGQDSADELVIYNPAIYSLNSLYGQFTMQELLELER